MNQKNQDSNLNQIDGLINQIAKGEDLNSKEAAKLFSEILSNDKDGYRFSILIAALHAKGETATELFELIKYFDRNAVKLSIKPSTKKIIDLSGTGGGSFKSINVSSLASLIVTAAGYTVPKSSYYGITSPTGSGDFFQSLGLNIHTLRKNEIKTALDQIGFCPFFVPFFSPKLMNFARLSSLIFAQQKIKIRTPIHLTSNICSPVGMKYRLYGCNDKKYLPIFAKIFQKLKFKKSLSVFGEPGMPEISSIGKTHFAEQNGEKIKFYSLTPRELGIRRAKPTEIASLGREQNIIDGLRILKGLEIGAKADLVIVNAAAALYILGETKNISAGLSKAKKILSSGGAYQVLHQLIEQHGNPELLQSWERKF